MDIQWVLREFVCVEIIRSFWHCSFTGLGMLVWKGRSVRYCSNRDSTQDSLAFRLLFDTYIKTYMDICLCDILRGHLYDNSVHKNSKKNLVHCGTGAQVVEQGVQNQHV